ncbi:MAG TPA: hypothetical protein VD789_03065 [Thermomicrobiales bacterium]|nr:hypothetical protein [Thermomicrobiales bacterium]
MTDRDERDSEQRQQERETFVVPGSMRSEDDLGDEDLSAELQQARDLGSASRSCVAIIAVLLFMALLICVFLIWAWFIR